MTEIEVKAQTEAHRHAVALRQCAIFAADAGDHIAKAMTDAADFLSDCEARIRSALIERKAEPLEHVEKVSTEAAMSQWERSLKRPDLCEKDRVRGAVEAYKRQAFDGWQPIETAPKDGTEVLCFGEYYGNPVRFVAVWNSAQWYAGWGSSIQPTHWQHLPPSPKPAAVSEGGEDE